VGPIIERVAAALATVSGSTNSARAARPAHATRAAGIGSGHTAARRHARLWTAASQRALQTTEPIQGATQQCAGEYRDAQK